MKLNRVLVTYKKPSKLRTASSRADQKRLMRVSPKLYRQTKDQQKSHLYTINCVRRVLKKLKISYRVVLRDKLQDEVKNLNKTADMIITIGGDGSVLAAAHVAGRKPVLGVNSLPKTSVGFFCGANAQNFDRKMASIISGRSRPAELPLLDIWIDGRKISYPALNDVLYAGESPAETVQYTIQIGRKKERQRGSGVWISAGPGSTAGIRSAGGKVSAIGSRRLQYYARELCAIPGLKYKLKRGFIPLGGSIKIISEIAHGRAYLDGINYIHPVLRGSVLKVRVSKQTLKIYL
jgi:NAD+ kinase